MSEPTDTTPAAALRPSAMLRREQQAGFVLAGVIAAGAISIGAIAARNLGAAAAELMASVVLAYTVRRGHRIFSAAAAFLAGLSFFYFFPLELACLIFSLYLTMRTTNAQSQLRRSQPPMTPAERRAAAAARAKRRRGETAADVSAPKTPAPNRRYTPPKAKPPTRAAKKPGAGDVPSPN